MSITSTADGLVLENERRGFQSFEKILELDHQHGFRFRQRHQIQLGFENDAERAFGTDHQFGQVERARPGR